jgi:hypothetical protein
MKVLKEILINNERWEMEFKSFGDAPMGRRFHFIIRSLSDKYKSVTIFNAWSRLHAYPDYSATPYIYDTFLEARVAVIKYLLNENI